MKSTAVGREAKRRFWADRIREWKLSGLSQAEYCRKHRIRTRSFGYWKRKLTESELSTSLVEIPGFDGTQILSRANPLFLIIGGRYRIELERGFDPDALDQLLGVLESR